ncbi:SUMO-specific isopeptidase USPL1 isoform X2 [Sceloporus undulatus]|uniref:SUMO-specific isopeptidase USPL1 isoform X2 n=1 Tax=Sceloporus undulatus TaxID=8520 RepID=UPI001C4BB3CB|nr:SUMO-specific isopeptidase USPL1 isoform X2 [Sceloporus undulatus]
MEYQKIGNGLQVTDIGTSALHMVGYLGKDCSSAEISPDECCPACRKKGLIQPLRTHRINFKELIFLCENPQCIYPLGFEPLSNIITPIDPKDYLSQGSSRKRKFFDTSLVTSSFEPHLKLTRSDNLIDTKQTLVPKCHGNNTFETHLGQPDFPKAHQPDVCNTADSMERQIGLEMAATENLPGMSIVQTQLLSGSESGSSMPQILPQDKQSLPEQLWLQWRNAHALCWLDCILSALVHLETLKKIRSESISKNISVIQRLLIKYNEAIALVNNYRRGENTVEVPSDIVSKAESHLNEIRNIIFVQLQPQLKCEEESPLFAFPLLLHKDSEIEKLFLHSFSWNLECSQCGYHISDRCQKTLTTFTNIIPEWHPLNAVHIAPCNNCNHKSQRRKMVLENVPPVFMVHFVEGLSHNNLAAYSFQFQDDSYQIKAVVQYQKKEKHFITWVLNSDETWLECDDLKGLYCRKHKSFGVPPAEIHIVIWEREAPQMTSDRDLQLQSERAMNIPPLKEQQKSLGKNHDDKPVEITPLICHTAEKLHAFTNKAETLDTNNNSSLLCGNDDIITLNLVSIPLDSEGKPLEDSHIVQNNLVAKAGISQLQRGQLNMFPLTSEESISLNKCKTPEHSAIPLHQRQPSNASDLFVMPAVLLNSSSNLPATSPVQGAEPEVNLVPVKDNNLVNSQSEASKAKSENSWQRLSNTAEHRIETTSNCHVSPSSTLHNSSQSHHKRGMKSFSANWVKSLVGKCTSVPKGGSIFKKEEDAQKSIKKEASYLLGRHASHFQGFQAKSSGKLVDLGSSQIILPPPSTTSPFNLPFEKHTTVGSEGTVTKRPGSWVTSGKQIQPSQNCIENKNSASVENSKPAFDKTHQLRLELLQELKAKKEKQVALDKLKKVQVKKGSIKKIKKNQSQLGSQKGGEPLQRLLNELQHQIDIEDSKSVNSAITNMSQCSNSSDEDFLSELLSPATTIASLELPHEEECRYLEMGGGSPKSPTANQKSDGIQIINHEHSYYSPVKENGHEDQTDLLAVRSPLKKLDFDSPVKQDILDDLFFSSVLNSTTASAEDFHYFDETLLT